MHCPAPSRRASRPRSRLVAALAAAAVSAAALLLIPGTAGAAGTTVRVPQSALAPSCGAPSPAKFCTELTGPTPATAAVVQDPRAQLGKGYLRLSTPTGDDHATVWSTAYLGRKLSEIDTLTLSTLIEQVSTGNSQAAPALNIQIDPKRPDLPADFKGKKFSTLVWEPIYTGTTVTPGVWQNWTPSSSQGWWATRTNFGAPNEFGFNSYSATFAQVKAALPDAVVGLVGVNQGSGSPGLVAGADGFGVNGTTYDFENPFQADLSLAIPLPATTTPGATIVTAVTIRNAGPYAATAVRTAVSALPGLRITAAPGGIVSGGRSLAYLTPSIAPGATVTYPVTLLVEPTARGTVSLNAATTSAVPDPTPLDAIARPAATVVR